MVLVYLTSIQGTYVLPSELASWPQRSGFVFSCVGPMAHSEIELLELWSGLRSRRLCPDRDCEGQEDQADRKSKEFHRTPFCQASERGKKGAYWAHGNLEPISPFLAMFIDP
jgi:hypothetical protein